MQQVREEQAASPSRERLFERYRHVRFFSVGDATDESERIPVRRAALSTLPASDRSAVLENADPLDAEAAEFVRWVFEQTGVEIDAYRRVPLARRFNACLRSLRAGSAAEARRALQREPERLRHAVSMLLIGVTEFFREPHVFAYLDCEVLPRLAETGGEIRVWSAGCSDGAELYSVAMLLARRGLLERSVLVGTDCREEAISRAQQGWFDAARLECLDPDLRREFVVADGKGGRIGKRLRDAVRWRQGDVLAAPCDLESWDLILCRNLAIYLEPSSIARLWERLAASLRLGGFLVVGKSERPASYAALVRTAPCVFEKETRP